MSATNLDDCDEIIIFLNSRPYRLLFRGQAASLLALQQHLPSLNHR